jgi:hydrogenase maturation protease
MPPGETLVIGYGNTLRGDDGVGPRVAEAVEALGLPSVVTMACHQLAPEHAETVARFRRVVFVDASVEDHEPARLRPVDAGETTQLMAHAADPRTVLALARDLFGSTPEAWAVTIPAFDLGFGERFSPETDREFGRAVRMVGALCSGSGGEQPEPGHYPENQPCMKSIS